jgi:hypothetical protein
MSGKENRRAFPPDIQAVFVMAEEGDSCAVCIELEALIQTRHSLGAAGRGMSPLDVALEYLRRGWSPVPISHKSKAPLDKGWPATVVTEENAHQYFNGEAQNVGVRLGGLSDGLAGVDLDTIEAVRTGGYFLPRTLCFGRSSKPRSHWLYQSDLWQTEDKAAIQFKFAIGKGKDRKEQMIIAVENWRWRQRRTDSFPGSVHETGELIRWDEKENIARPEGDSLKQRASSIRGATCQSFPIERRPA